MVCGAASAPGEPQPGMWAHRGTPGQDRSAQCPGCPLWLGRIKDRGQWAAPGPGLPLPYLSSALAGEHEWKIVSTGITDCYFNVTELPPGSTAKFRVACVNKAGQGPYSNPSAKVHLEAAGEQALSRGRGAAMGPPVASGVLWGSLNPRASSPQSSGKRGAAHTPLVACPHLAHTSLCSLQVPELPQPRTLLSPFLRRWLPAAQPRQRRSSWRRWPQGPLPALRPASTREWHRRQRERSRRVPPQGPFHPLHPMKRASHPTLSFHPTSLSTCPPS